MRKIRKKVDALVELQPTPAVEALAAKMDTTTEKWRSLLAQRRGTAKANTAVTTKE